MKTTITRSFALRTLSIFTALTVSACVADSADLADPDLTDPDLADPPALGASPSDARPRVIALTALSPDRAPILAKIGESATVIDAGAQLDDAMLDGARAVLVDLSAINRDTLTEGARFLAAARARGLSVVLENVDDSERMSAMVGIGVHADLAVVTPRGASAANVTLFGGDPIEVSGGERGDEEVPASLHDAWLRGQGAGDVVSSVLAKIAAPVVPLSLNIPSNLPQGSYFVYYFDSQFPAYWSPPHDGQTAFITSNFSIALFAAKESGSTQTFKYLIVGDDGTAINPGALLWNNDYERGYYQEAVYFQVLPILFPPSMVLVNHAPETTNATGSYSTTTGFNVGMSGTTPTAGYDSSATGTQNLADFTVLDGTIGVIPKWTFRMSQTGDSTPYNSDDDLCHGMWSTLHTLPALAMYTVSPHYQAVYRMASDVTSTIQLVHMTEQRLRATWLTAETGLFCAGGVVSLGASGKIQKLINVDMNQVSFPQ